LQVLEMSNKNQVASASTSEKDTNRLKKQKWYLSAKYLWTDVFSMYVDTGIYILLLHCYVIGLYVTVTPLCNNSTIWTDI